MAPPITNVVDITVNVNAPAAADVFNFGVPIGVFTHDITDNRIDGPFFTIDEVVAAGFTASAAPAINTWASTVFAQDNAVDQLLIGRRLPPEGGEAAQVWQVDASGPTFVDETANYNSDTPASWTIFPDPEAVEDFAAVGMSEPFSKLTLDSTGGTQGVDGIVAWEYWDGSAWVALPGLTDNTAGFTAALGAGQTVEWTIPGDWEPVDLNGAELYYVRARITTVYTTNPVYSQGTVDGDTNWTDTMDQIVEWQALNGAADWYITNIESQAAADILELNTWVSSRDKIFIAQSADSDILDGDPGSIAQQLANLNTVRTALIYHADSEEPLDGAWSGRCGGFELDQEDGVGTWFGKTLRNVTFDALTGAQAQAILDANANFYGRNFGLSFTQAGTMAAGAPRFIDVTTSIDWTVRRLQEAVVGAFVAEPKKFPFTNAGINRLVGVVQGVLSRGVTYGHFSPDVPPVITVPRVQDVPLSDKGERQLAITAEVTLAGAIQKLIITLNVNF